LGDSERNKCLKGKGSRLTLLDSTKSKIDSPNQRPYAASKFSHYFENPLARLVMRRTATYPE
jgi:hypothetical protein